MMPAISVPRSSAATPALWSRAPLFPAGRRSSCAANTTAAPTTAKVTATESPPARGTERVLMRRSFGWSAMLKRNAMRRITAVPAHESTAAAIAMTRRRSGRGMTTASAPRASADPPPQRAVMRRDQEQGSLVPTSSLRVRCAQVQLDLHAT
ncbi:unannotated protein [freshwater metagenome]|uniref:Unannotated protein n=1 Tax=freshwater metagenome TaxID=449393 RepID=A0A6J7C0U2_9ZZZZ